MWIAVNRGQKALHHLSFLEHTLTDKLIAIQEQKSVSLLS